MDGRAADGAPLGKLASDMKDMSTLQCRVLIKAHLHTAELFLNWVKTTGKLQCFHHDIEYSSL